MKNFILLGLLLIVSGCNVGRGEVGVHRGHITDVSEAGWVCKTFEGQIMSGSGNSAQSYDFTVTDRHTYELLLQAQKSGAEVVVHYYSPRIYSLCSSEHSVFVDGVEFTK